jgi:hypothetical protein
MEEVTVNVVPQPEAIGQHLNEAVTDEPVMVMTPSFSNSTKKAFNFDQCGSTAQVRNLFCVFVNNKLVCM